MPAATKMPVGLHNKGRRVARPPFSTGITSADRVSFGCIIRVVKLNSTLRPCRDLNAEPLDKAIVQRGERIPGMGYTNVLYSQNPLINVSKTYRLSMLCPLKLGDGRIDNGYPEATREGILSSDTLPDPTGLRFRPINTYLRNL